MATTNSTLLTNLQSIYNTKLQIKAAIPTNSDIFSDYPGYITALKPSGYAYITSNGDHNIASYEMVNVDVEVGIPAGYTYVSGTSYITTNGSHNVSSYEYAYVTVEGGSGSSVDPWYNSTNVGAMIENEETTADYVGTNIAENFTVTLDQNEENVEAVEWDFYVSVPTEELDQYDNPIYEQKKVHVIVSSNDDHGVLNIAIDIAQNLEDYPDLYDNIYPILENATLTESEDPSNDGYDYLLEGDIYAWNLSDNNALVEEITENGFYPNDGCLGFNVNVPGDAYTTAISVQEMIENGDTDAEYVSSCIMSDFNGGAGGSSWAETVTIDTGEVDQNDEPILEEKKVLFAISGNDGSDMYDYLEDYPDLYENIFPTIKDATLSVATGTDAEEGYDYVLEGELYAWNLNDMSEPVVEITQNGFYPTASDVSLGFNVNVPSGGITPSGTITIDDNEIGNTVDVISYAYAYIDIQGGSLSQGLFYIFNFLEMGGGNGAKIYMDNKALSDLALYNLEPVNYIDPTTQEDTHNSFYSIELYDSIKDTHLVFDDIYPTSHYNSNGNYMGFKSLANESLSDTIDSVHVTSQVWVIDNDPQYLEGGYWEASDSYSASFSDSYTITSDDEVVISVHSLQNNLLAELFINGILVEENVILEVD